MDFIKLRSTFERFLLLVIRGIRRQIGNACPVTVKISDEKGCAGDLSIAEISTAGECLEAAGDSAIRLSAHSGYLTYLTEKLKKSVGIPVMLKLLLLPLAGVLNLIAQGISGSMAKRTRFY